MAIPGAVGKDNLDISFRLHSKSQVFDGSTNVLTNARLNIVSSASSFGLVFVGSTNAEIFVICTKDLELPTALTQNAPVRKIPMPSQITQLAVNCDGSILAVDAKINGVPHIQLYSVPSFLSPNIQKISEFRLSTDNSSSIQLCWNPVLNTVLAVCTETGGLNLYSIKEQGLTIHSIDPSLKAKCCSFSPKGKQLVAGFSNGKLMQFNMEMKPARTIECPPGIFPGGSFDVVAIQWLSTYQFAVAFLSHQPESRPIVHIVNAPKAGPPQYIAYNDVCYSSSETRPSKIYFLYIQAWGMILITSANCVDVSFLRIHKPGDIPEWIQEFPNDQFPAELPLTPEKEETFPCGFEIDTASCNKILQEDGNPFPIMPMIHVVSTYGVMCSFYVMNTTPSYADICSPPRPIDPRIQSLFVANNVSVSQSAPKTLTPPAESVFKTPTKTEAAPISHSTPALPKTNLFGAPTTASPFSLAPQSQSNAFSGFSLPQQTQAPTSGFSMTSMASKPIATTQPTVQSQPLLVTPANVTVPQNKTLLATPVNQPLITVPPTYTPQQQQAIQQKQESVKEATVADKLSEIEDEQVYIKMIQDEVKEFELELNFLMEKSRSLKVNIGTKEESAEMRKKLEELDELKKEATETIESLKSDVQTNRLGLTEMLSMVYEAKAKCNQANKEKSIIMPHNQIQDRSSKRTLEKLKKMISQCEMQINIVIQLLNSQWANYQDTLSRNKKNKMHIPSLEGVYQTLTKQQEIVYNLNAKVKLFKAKLGICDDVKKQKNSNINATIESLSDSIISMSLIDQVQNEKSKMTAKKHKNLLNYLENREVVTIKPQRPQLPGLNSEIIIEKKMKALKNLKKPEPKKNITPQKDTKPFMPPAQQAVPRTQPSETVYDFASSTQKSSIFTPVTNSTVAPTSQPQISLTKKEETQKSTGFSFGQNSAPFSMNSTLPAPTFGASTPFSSTSLVANVERKKEELKIQTVPQVKSDVKPASTISNTNVSVSAKFSVALPSKTAEKPQKEAAKVEEKKTEEVKPLTSNETASFTFSLSSNKKETAQPSSMISFGNTPSSAVSDSVKSAFSFGGTAAPNAFGFGSAPKVSEAKTTSSSTSIFGNSGTTFGFANTTKVSPTASTNIFTSPNAPQAAKPTEETVTKSTAQSTSEVSSTTVTSSISVAKSAPATDAKSSFSFASFGNAAPNTTVSSSSSIFAPKPDAAAVTSTTTAESSTNSQVSSTDSVLQGLNICSPTTISSSAGQTATSPGNIFGAPLQSAKTDTKSIFGSSSFASSFGTSTTSTTTVTQASVFSSPPAVTTTTQSSQPFSSTTTTTSAASPSIFAQPTFGSLDLSGNKATSPTSPPTGNIFAAAALVKPDQSVFGQPAVTTSAPTSGTFSNIFAAAAANTAKPANVFGTPTSNVFGSTTTTSTTSVFGSVSTTSPAGVFGSSTAASPSIFGQSTQPSSGSIFGQTATTSSGSIFGQAASTTTTASTGSIFSQSSFSSSNTGASGGNIFGGSTGTTQSPFGAASIFGSSTQNNTQQTASIFGGSSAFGGQASSATSTNIFGGSANAAPQPTSPFGSASIFAQNQSAPTFGGNATFSNTLGGSTFGGTGASIFSQQQNQPVFGGGASFGSPKSNIFGSSIPTSPPQQQTGNIFEQLGSQQSSNLFGSLAQTSPPPVQQGGFSGSAFSSWR